MARRPRDSRLETREARLKLAPRKEPYWRQIHAGLAIGYYRGSRSSSWTCRRTREAGEEGRGRWRYQRLGIADDHADADGERVLSYAQAVKGAMGQADATTRQRLQLDSDRREYTVRACIAEYLVKLRATSSNPQATEYKFDRHVLPALGDRPVGALTAEELEKWFHGLAAGRSKATANRIFRAFKAALNHAYRHGKVATDAEWRKVKMFPNAEKPRTDYLSQQEAKRLLNACDEDFRNLVRAALLTGARYGELIATEVRDFDAKAGTLRLRKTKSGKERYAPLTDEAMGWFKSWCAGRSRDEQLFLRANGEPWATAQQVRRMRDASKQAKLGRPVSFHILRHTYGSLLALKGVPLKFIAEAMGHADLRMTEAHYAHLQKDDAVAKAIRKSLPSFGKASGKVASL